MATSPTTRPTKITPIEEGEHPVGHEQVRAAKLAILAASLLAGLIACAVFTWVAKRGDGYEAM